MNRLKAYVRRTILASAREQAAWYRGQGERPREALRSGLKVAFTDASRGTDTGWWNDLIYTADVERLALRYRRDICCAVVAYLDETGADPADRSRPDDPSLNDVLLACALARDTDDLRDGRFDALSYGLHFAVEWLTHEVAREMGVEL